jgi:hypothetical protein
LGRGVRIRVAGNAGLDAVMTYDKAFQLLLFAGLSLVEADRIARTFL